MAQDGDGQDVSPGTGDAGEGVAPDGGTQSAEQSAEAPERITLPEAYELAKAELAGEGSEARAEASDDGSQGEDQGAETSETARETATAEPDAKAEPEKTDTGERETGAEEATGEDDRTTKGTLDRINSLVEQGRENELTPHERGVLRRLRERVEQQHQQETRFRDLYLQFERMKTEDPEGWTKFLDDHQQPDKVLAFMRAYKRDHPEVSLDNPDARPQPSAEQIRAQVEEEQTEALDGLVDQLAKAAGVEEELPTLRKEADGRHGALISAITKTAIEKGVEKMRESVRREEREAAEREMQAKFAPRMETHRVLPGVNGESRPPAPTGNTPRDRLEQAYYESLQELEKAG